MIGWKFNGFFNIYYTKKVYFFKIAGKILANEPNLWYDLFEELILNFNSLFTISPNSAA